MFSNVKVRSVGVQPILRGQPTFILSKKFNFLKNRNSALKCSSIIKESNAIEFCPIFSPRQHFTKSFPKLVFRFHGNGCCLSVNKRRLPPQYASKLHETCTICFLGGLGLTEYFSWCLTQPTKPTEFIRVFSHTFSKLSSLVVNSAWIFYR